MSKIEEYKNRQENTERNITRKAGGKISLERGVGQEHDMSMSNVSQDFEQIKNILAASMMAQSLNCCLEKKYLDTLSLSDSVFEIVNESSSGNYTPISWLKIEQVGKPALNSLENCFFYIQKILHSCAIPNRRLTFLVIGNGITNSLYLGLRNLDGGNIIVRNEMCDLNHFSKACWPGLITKQIDEENDELKAYFKKKYRKVTAITGIPTVADNPDFTTIEQVIQGMQGQEFAYLVTADPLGSERIDELLMQCREIAGQLESMRSMNITKAIQSNRTDSFSETDSVFENWGESENEGKTGPDLKTLIGGGLLFTGLSMAAATFFPPALAMLPGVEQIFRAASVSSKPLTTFFGLSGVAGAQLLSGFIPHKTKGTGRNWGKGNSHSVTEGVSFSKGMSESISKTLVNKHVDAAVRQLALYEKRYEQAKATGAWSVSCNLLTETASSAPSWQLKSLLSGVDSSLEPIRIHDITSLLNGDDGVHGTAKTSKLRIKYKGDDAPYFNHPFGADFSQLTTLLTTKELSALINFPLNSVSGIPVIEHAALAKEVVRYSETNQDLLDIGCIFDYGLEYPKTRVSLTRNSLAQHVFITGSTGCGKSETVYKIIDEARKTGAKFLVVEPAKGEYKNVFGNTKVYGTNPHVTRLLHLNPFVFPVSGNSIHVLEHVDRLVEIFNVCWPMYAAMPAVLKKAVLRCYEKCGWDLAISECLNCDTPIFPTFDDLFVELRNVIEESAYNDDVKSNYVGSLLTRVESLTNGINGEVFNSKDLGDEVLFNDNVIVDLSRVGSQETKSLIMGLLIMRLSEYRMTEQLSGNSELRHITVLEEAHNILKRTSIEPSAEGSNMVGKSVEMLTNAIAEMRTYGEGFIIVDQSPTSVAPAAIKNTNTKIIMRLPDCEDRIISGKSACMNNEQIDEIAKLPTGVGVVYQNDWVEPVLCKFDMYNGERTVLAPVNRFREFNNSKEFFSEVLKLLLKGRINSKIKLDTEFILRNVQECRISSSLKHDIVKIISELNDNDFSIWSDSEFPKLSRIVMELFSAKEFVKQAVRKAESFEELDNLLNEFIATKTDIQENQALVVRQCLMHEYGEINQHCRRIYNAWFVETRNRLL